MTTLKTFQTVFLTAAISILAGCSDEITSLVSVSQEQKKAAEPEAEENLSTNSFHSKIILSPGQSGSFSYENTGFYRFNSILIPECNEIKNDIEVTGYLDDLALVLGCSAKEFWVASVTITNISVHKIELDIHLTGSKVRVTNPGHGTVKTE